jgi:isopentenyldiphosphate isomerase
MREIKRQVSAGAVLALMFLLIVSLYGYSGKHGNAIYDIADIDYGDLMVDDSSQDHTDSDEKVGYTCGTTQEAGEMLREGLKNRKTTIVINYTGTVSDANDTSLKIHNIALKHTGVGNEGDYLNWNHTKIARKYSSKTKSFTYQVTYLDSAQQEKETTAAIKKLESKLGIKKSDSTYKKIYTIYEYLAKHISYDYDDTTDLPYTAYDAVINGKAVCQGYATLFYRILLDYGIDNRIIVSKTHAWNLVKVNGKYYECDLTWDSQGVQSGQKFEYLLKAKISDSDHKWRNEVLDSDVKKLPRASSNYKVSKAARAQTQSKAA